MKQEELRFQTILTWIFDLAAVGLAVWFSVLAYHHVKDAAVSADFETAYLFAAMLFYSFAFYWNIDCRTPTAANRRDLLPHIAYKCVFTVIALFILVLRHGGGKSVVLPLLTGLTAFICVSLVRLIFGVFTARYYVYGKHGVLSLLVTQEGRREHSLRRMQEDAFRFRTAAVILTDLAEEDAGEESQDGEIPVLPFDRIRDFLKTHPVSCVILDLDDAEAVKVAGMSERWLYEGISILRRISDEEAELLPLQREYIRIGDSDFRLTNSRARQERTQFIKRCADLVIGAAGSLVTLLVSIPLGIAIRIGSKGPVFVPENYVGKDGRIYKRFAFRTTYMGSELKKNLLISRSSSDVPARESHPQMTSAGRAIERMGIGFLPQFFSVLTGSMSLVGVHPISEDDFLGNEHIYRQCLYCKPGMIWPARADEDTASGEVTEAAIEPDILYAQNWSLWYDVITVADRFRVKYEQTHRTRRE